jgi:hypothetical protein
MVPSMPKEDEVELLREINENLKVIRKLTEMQLRGPIKDELTKFASSTERRKMWMLCDGALSTIEMSKRIGVSPRAVQYFVQDGLTAGFLRVDRRGYPSRTIDWTPPEWERVPGEKPKEESKT